jgi:hypothetical protein
MTKSAIAAVLVFVATLAVGAAPGAAAADATITELVTPIAFYPDALVAQVLVASAHGEEIAQAAAWLEDEAPWRERERAQAIDDQTWHPEVKALAMTPPVLGAMRRNPAWTVALGEAYARNAPEVLNAVQAVRHTAQAAGALGTTSGQRVIVRGSAIVLEPVDATFVYVPGVGVFDVGAADRFAWGWQHWQVDWQSGAAAYQNRPDPSPH